MQNVSIELGLACSLVRLLVSSSSRFLISPRSASAFFRRSRSTSAFRCISFSSWRTLNGNKALRGCFLTYVQVTFHQDYEKVSYGQERPFFGCGILDTGFCGHWFNGKDSKAGKIRLLLHVQRQKLPLSWAMFHLLGSWFQDRLGESLKTNDSKLKENFTLCTCCYIKLTKSGSWYCCHQMP